MQILSPEMQRQIWYTTAELVRAQELRPPLRSPWNFGCVGPRNATWHFFGAQERRSPAFPLTLTTGYMEDRIGTCYTYDMSNGVISNDL